MPNDRSDSNLFNPLLAWADLGMRAAEMALASTQNIGDAADRMARAGASAEPDDIIATRSAVPGKGQATAPAALGNVGSLHRTVFDLLTESWVRWMSALGTVASLPAGIGLARTVGHRDNPLEAVRSSLRPAAWGEKPATGRKVGSMTYPAQRRRDSTIDMQHALASGDAKPRRKAAATRKGARRSARK